MRPHPARGARANRPTRALLGVAVALGACAPSSGDGAEAPAPEVRVHVHQNATNGLVNQYLVETAASVVAVDAGFLLSDVEAVEAMIDSIGKPLRAILVTHAHLDHTNGVARLSDDGAVPAYAPPRTILEHEVRDYSERLPHLRSLYPPGVPRLTPVRDGFELDVDGVVFRLLEMGPGESEWDAVWTVGGERPSHVFVGDLLLNQVHAFFQSGRSMEWIRSLDDLLELTPADARVYAGHGPPEAGRHELSWQRDYIVRAREAVPRVAGGADSLSDDAERRLYAEMSSWLPPNRLDFLILLGGDVLASELALEAERRVVDEKLAALGGS